MSLPFLLSDKDWQELRPREIDTLGQQKEIDPEKERFLRIFRTVDMRVEWVCGKMVIVFNIVVILCATYILINGVQLLNIFKEWITK